LRGKALNRILVIVIPLAGAALLWLIALFVAENVTFWPCPSYTFFGIYCPGCGTTRAVKALLGGDILLAIRQNAAIPALILLAALYYLEFALKIFGVRFRIQPLHNVKFMVILLVLWLAYFILRNFIPAIAPI